MENCCIHILFNGERLLDLDAKCCALKTSRDSFHHQCYLFLLQCEKVCIEGESRDETESEDE